MRGGERERERLKFQEFKKIRKRVPRMGRNKRVKGEDVEKR